MFKFSKVSYEQFEKDSIALGFKPTRDIYDAIQLPKRATKKSAGYDFFTPYDIDIKNTTAILSLTPTANYLNKIDIYNPNTFIIPTSIRVELDPDQVLLAMPKSGHGFKTGTTLANTVGVIDADYFESDNEGHIMLKLVAGFKAFHLDAGKSVMQGICVKYCTEDDEKEVTTQRNGGFGSTSDNQDPVKPDRKTRSTAKIV